MLPVAWQPDFAQLVEIKGLTVPENVVVIVLQSTVSLLSFLLSFLQANKRTTINAIQTVKPGNFFIQDVLG